jgi:hypothetical protein
MRPGISAFLGTTRRIPQGPHGILLDMFMPPKGFFAALLFFGALSVAPQAEATTGLSGVGRAASGFSSFGNTVIGHSAYGGPSPFTPYGSLNAIGGYGAQSISAPGAGNAATPPKWTGKPISVVKTGKGKTFHFGSFAWDKQGKGHSISHGHDGHHLHFPGCGHDDHDGGGGGGGGGEGGEGGGTPVVPEPASWGLMIIGLGVIGTTMRRRFRAASGKNQFA